MNVPYIGKFSLLIFSWLSEKNEILTHKINSTTNNRIIITVSTLHVQFYVAQLAGCFTRDGPSEIPTTEGRSSQPKRCSFLASTIIGDG